MRTFERDGYHFERWAEIKNLSQLTDGHYHLILLDVQGVGLNESPTLQGLGVLKAIKNANPTQAVILYSAQPQSLASNDHVMLADAVFDKGMSYVDYKQQVDQLLQRRFTPGYFISLMNRELAENAVLVPKAVPKALRAMRKGDSRSFTSYLSAHLPDEKQVDRIIAIVGAAATTISLFQS